MQLNREDLFTLNIGLQEDQLAIYWPEGDLGLAHTDLAMRDGLFYISDGRGQKIVRYNSYGDLLVMVYNEQTNPLPLSLRPLQPDTVVTRWLFSYPFEEPGKIAVDSRKHLYVADKLPFERHSFDRENQTILDSVLLHFDENGRFIKYLGKEGIGGSPFPSIAGIYISSDDDVVVTCRLPRGWDIFWFDRDGTLKLLMHLLNANIPTPQNRESYRAPLFSSVDALCVAPDEQHIYLKVDYYRDTFDEQTNTRTAPEPDSSVVWILDAQSGSYISSIEVPFFEYTFSENGRQHTEKMIYSLLGSAAGGRVFLSYPVEGGYSILTLPTEFAADPTQHQGFIQVADEELVFNSFNLSEDGVLSALLVSDWNVKVVWWRTDKLIGTVP
ncbi:lipoprotein [Spirochaetia bacterium]|nr:lipoprotein [Spirochaetia bacterium]